MLSKAVQTKKVMLIDDEPAAINNLRSVISSFDELEIIAEIGDGKNAIREITEQQPDIVFLDIEMPEVDGFDVAKATAHINYQLVFVTAYEQYALDAFDTNAIDYLLKPVRPSILRKCIQKILYQEELALEVLQKQKSPDDNTQNETLVLSDGNAMRVLEQKHVSYIEGIGRYRRIHLTKGGTELHRLDTIISDTTLEEFEYQLTPDAFVRLHRSYIVNLRQIIGLVVESRRHFVNLVDLAIKIPVSRGKVQKLKTFIVQKP